MANEQAEIRMYTCDPCILTPEEFEDLVKETHSHFIAHDFTVADRICCRLIYEHWGRYVEAAKLNGRKVHPHVLDFAAILSDYYAEQAVKFR